MAENADVTSLRVVELGDGRFAAVPDGLADGWSGETFAAEAEAEAEARLFEQSQATSVGNDLGILTPGGGQGVR